MKKTPAVAFAAVLLLAAPGAWAAGGKEKPTGEGPIVVASKIDTEGALLGQMIVLSLRAGGFQVTDRTEFGTTDVIRKAMFGGEIDIYPEYTGNGGFFFESADSGIWKDAEKAYRRVKELDLERNGIVWLSPASANNTWAIAVRRDLSEKEGLRTLGDFARYVDGGGKVKLAGSEEFVSRPDALPAFEKAYGFKLAESQMLVVSGGNTAQTEKAAAEATDGVNFAMAYGTDGAIAAFDLRVLQDTKGVQPVYQPAPIVRKEILDRYPAVQGILEPVFHSLDLEKLQSLNGKIVVEGRVASEVAREYLESAGFLE